VPLGCTLARRHFHQPHSCQLLFVREDSVLQVTATAPKTVVAGLHVAIVARIVAPNGVPFVKHAPKQWRIRRPLGGAGVRSPQTRDTKISECIEQMWKLFVYNSITIIMQSSILVVSYACTCNVCWQ